MMYIFNNYLSHNGYRLIKKESPMWSKIPHTHARTHSYAHTDTHTQNRTHTRKHTSMHARTQAPQLLVCLLEIVSRVEHISKKNI